MLTYGTGVGGAVVMDGGIYTGGSFSAGEVGGMVVHGGQRDAEADISAAATERYASVTALVNAAGEAGRFTDRTAGIFCQDGEPQIRETVATGLMKSLRV